MPSLPCGGLLESCMAGLGVRRHKCLEVTMPGAERPRETHTTIPRPSASRLGSIAKGLILKDLETDGIVYGAALDK